MSKKYYVYILTNRSRTLYTGMTNNLARRLEEHRSKHYQKSFTKRYSINRLVYFEELDHPADAIQREKQIKGWLRKKKIQLIESVNSEWLDLTEDILPD